MHPTHSLHEQKCHCNEGETKAAFSKTSPTLNYDPLFEFLTTPYSLGIKKNIFQK